MDEATRRELLKQLRKAREDLDLGQRMYQEGQALAVPGIVNKGTDLIDQAKEDIRQITQALALPDSIMASVEAATRGDHLINLTVGDDDVRRLAELAAETLPVVEAYRARDALTPDKTNGIWTDDKMDAMSSSIRAVAARLRTLSAGTYPEEPTGATKYLIIVNGGGGGDLRAAVKGIASLLLDFERRALDEPWRYPAVDAAFAQQFGVIVADLKALCGGAEPAERVGSPSHRDREPDKVGTKDEICDALNVSRSTSLKWFNDRREAKAIDFDNSIRGLWKLWILDPSKVKSLAKPR